ncbi:MAG: hypothetical protein IT379_15065 [Deltaproteobacteria bacterium]|nr:hypothetical protein [Deltaproteobacteria bacterium]
MRSNAYSFACPIALVVANCSIAGRSKAPRDQNRSQHDMTNDDGDEYNNINMTYGLR